MYKVDGTQAYSDTDQSRRFNSGPTWAQNSCALDSILVLMLLLDMGRCRVDQMSEALQQANQAQAQLASTAMAIIRKPWSVLTTKDITGLRDVVREGLHSYDRGLYPIGGLHAATSIFDLLTLYSPQCFATWAVIIRCCPASQWMWKTQRDGSVKAHRLNGLYVPVEMVSFLAEATTFAQQVQMLLSPYPAESSTAKSPSPSGACKHSAPTAQQQKVLLDRPPPTLTFRDFQGGPGKPGMYQDVTLRFLKWSGAGFEHMQAKYTCWGCVYCINGNHFIVVINKAARQGGSDFICYDGMARPNVKDVKESFEDFAQKGHIIALLIYVRIE